MKNYNRDKYVHNSYMCRTNRHKWVIDREATEEVNGLKHCKWCGIEQSTILYSLIKLMKNRKAIKIDFAPIMSESNSIIEGL